MIYYSLQSTDEPLILADTPFASGGEGNLHRVVQPAQHKDKIAKIYYAHKRTARRESKLQYLVKNPPKELRSAESKLPNMAWPQELVYDEDGQFVGFLMLYIEGEKLETLCTAKLPKKLSSTEWQRFDFKNKDALKLRQKLCFNIAAAIHNVHDTGRYVMIDLKPDNILVQSNGLISLVDMDSIAVVHGGTTLFDAPVATPEYTPPETYQKGYQRELAQQETWDRFSLGIIFYKLLFGIHPYAATCRSPYDKADTLDEKIRHGLFVHTQTELKECFTIVPQPHRHFNRVHIGLRELFTRCFDAGTANPNLRPRAEEWCYAILTGQQAQEIYTLPSELLDVPVLAYADRSFQKIFDAWNKPTFEEPTAQPTPPSTEQMIRFRAYGVPLELRLINGALFVMSWVMIFTLPFSLYSGSLMWVILAIVSSHDTYGYYFRSERRERIAAKAKSQQLQAQYEKDLSVARQFFKKIIELWQPLQELYDKIPFDKVRQWLIEQSLYRRKIEAFKVFLEQQDIQTQKVIEAEEEAAKSIRAQQQRQLVEDPILVGLKGNTVSQKLQSLLMQENEALAVVEGEFSKRKAVFEQNIEKHQKIAELHEQEQQIKELIEQLKTVQGPRIETESEQRRKALLEQKRKEIVGSRNDIRANAAGIFSDFDSNPTFIYNLIDNLLLKEGISESTQVRNVVTNMASKEFYWEDKTHLVYLRDRIVKIYERYDKTNIERALRELLLYAQRLDKDIYNTQLSDEEEAALENAYKTRVQKHRRRLQEKEEQLEEVLSQKQNIIAELQQKTGEMPLTLDQWEREYNEAIAKAKERFNEPKNFLRECMEELVQDRRTVSQQYIQNYEKLIERCTQQHTELTTALQQYHALLSEEDHQNVSNFIKQQNDISDQMSKLQKEFVPIEEQLRQSARQCADARYQAMRYKLITFGNHLRQVFLFRK